MSDVLIERIDALRADIADIKRDLSRFVTLDRYQAEMKSVEQKTHAAEQKADRSVRVSTWVLGLLVTMVVGGLFGWMLVVSQGAT